MHKPTYEAIAKEINIDPHNYNRENPCDLDNTISVLVWYFDHTSATEF